MSHTRSSSHRRGDRIAGSLPKPAWLAETHKLWPRWRAEGDALRQAKADATLLWIKEQEDAGLDIVTDGEQSRQHFVRGFVELVEGIDFEQKVEMGIRDDRYKAMVPQVVGPLRLKGRVHAFEARLARAHTQSQAEIHAAGADDDRRHRGRPPLRQPAGTCAGLRRTAQPGGARAALERVAQGLTCTTAVHICYGYGIQANNDWKKTLGEEWRRYEQVFPALAASSIGQVSLECYHSHVPPDLMALLKGKDVLVGGIDVASDGVGSAEQVADTIGRALKFVQANR